MNEYEQMTRNRVGNPRWSESVITRQFAVQNCGNSSRAVAVASWKTRVEAEELLQEVASLFRHSAARRLILAANMSNSAADPASNVISNKLEAQFRFYADRWYQAIKFVSSTTRMTTDPNYFKIIGMGNKVVPFILHELERVPAPWFVALRVLTGNIEVGREHRGNFEKIAESWVEWGRRNAII